MPQDSRQAFILNFFPRGLLRGFEPEEKKSETFEKNGGSERWPPYRLITKQLLCSPKKIGCMKTEEKIKVMNEVKQGIIDYLQEQLTINSDALRTYDERETPIINSDQEIKRMREIEAIKLRDRIHEITRHISVIKRM